MVFPFITIVNSEPETSGVAKEFSKHLNTGDIVLLNGELGTGKTFFVKAVCGEFGITNVTSPSFAIVNEYRGALSVNHLDFYRIKKVSELIDIGINDYLSDDALTFIEWAESYPEILPHKYFRINIEYINDVSRKIVIEKNG